mmetsp:Transcript_6148/g.11754  ORF Transcript_6148/g.11754 Transcript_6148/m.11754 type:complete len:577 (-) Transcript_6148:2094-3824(-)|eukprot:CAMPEP_0114257918 /NCGR_PEP_ID=MMETSP0058-20121206/19007_1 /TAXON_ID=36894 /ORGANISM="Pyramimonas parkeae, CCMP726" /LENGTH=576 /DNA_ID=CAMNT_0001372713 /DNA_START=243 /DNA_END=1973 /DNA_ORIENTATION=-
MFPRLKGRVVKGYPHIVVGDEVPSKLIKLDSPVESEVENIGDDQTITPGSQHLDSTSDACDDDSFPRLVPPTGVTPGTPLEMRDGSCPQVMHLSPVDTHVLLRQATVVWAVVYQDVLDENKLERAIARALSSYPELAGRLREGMDAPPRWKMFGTPNWLKPRYIWSKLAVDVVCNNQGVVFTVAKSEAPLAAFDGTGPLNDKLRAVVDTLDMNLIGTNKPLLRIKLTLLAGGGCVLGLSATHILVDGFSLMNFLHAVSRNYETLDQSLTRRPRDDERVKFMEGVPPIHRWVDCRFDKLGFWDHVLKEFEMAYKVMLSMNDKAHYEVIALSAENVKNMKTHLSKEICNQPGQYLSANDCVVAFTWLVMRALRNRHNCPTTSHPPTIAQAINMRTRVAGMDQGYFGNGAYASGAGAPPDATAAEMAMCIRAAVDCWKSKEFTRTMVGSMKSEASQDNVAERDRYRIFHSDGLITSWQFPIWDLSFAGQKPMDFYGTVDPQVATDVAILWPARSSTAKPSGSSEPEGGACMPSKDPSAWSECGVRICIAVPKQSVKGFHNFWPKLLKDMSGSEVDSLAS